MSSPLGCRSAGKSCPNRFDLLGQPAWIAAVMDESIQVSRTSFSPRNSRPPHLGQVFSGNLSFLGSTGRSPSSGMIVDSHFVQYHTGIGVAKILCLEITQSQSRDSAQSMSRCLAKGGTQSSFPVHSTTFCVRSRVFMNHWGLAMISTGVWHRQHVPIFCCIVSVLLSSPFA